MTNASTDSSLSRAATAPSGVRRANPRCLVQLIPLALLLGLVAWKTQAPELAWPSWQCSAWLGALIGVGSFIAADLAEFHVGWLRRALTLVLCPLGFAQLSEGVLPGQILNHFWLWFTLMAAIWLIVYGLRIGVQIARSWRSSGQDSCQFTLAQWMFFVTGLGVLLSLAQHAPVSAEIPLSAIQLFAFPILTTGLIMGRLGMTVRQKLLVVAAACTCNVFLCGLWTNQWLEQLQLAVLFLLQLGCLSLCHMLAAPFQQAVPTPPTTFEPRIATFETP